MNSMALMVMVAALAWQEIAVPALRWRVAASHAPSTPDMGSSNPFPTLLLIQ
jgi:hypothetical protein